jgi:oligoribonuclease NrnB/cAMP/cGMP phosphodiesterase (DHH superfamily)
MVVFTHKDLDGVVSYLTLCWAVDKRIPVVPTTPAKLASSLQKYLASQKEEPSQMFFLDLDCTTIGDQIDKAGTVIIDHHKTHLYPYKHAKTFVYTETSSAKQVFDTFFKKSGKDLSDARKTLVALADDWDSGTNSTPLSRRLNIVFHQTQNKFDAFVEDYWDGFQPFDQYKKNTIALYEKHAKEHLQQLTPFVGIIDFDGHPTKVGAVMANEFVDESIQFLLNNLGVEVAIVVMTDHKRFSVRRSLNSNVDVSKFVQRVSSGGGHEQAAGGPLTEEFAQFTQLLSEHSE